MTINISKFYINKEMEEAEEVCLTDFTKFTFRSDMDLLVNKAEYVLKYVKYPKQTGHLH